MSLSPSYQAFHQQAQNLQYKFQDMLGSSNDPVAHELRSEIHHLVDDIALNKDPRDIEHRVLFIKNQIEHVQRSGSNLMSYEHTDAVNHQMEQMRQQIRGLSNY